MIDPVGGPTSTALTQRTQSNSQVTSPRSVDILNAVQTSSKKSSGSTGGSGVKIFTVPAAAKSGTSSNKTPRGSFVDVLV